MVALDTREMNAFCLEFYRSYLQIVQDTLALVNSTVRTSLSPPIVPPINSRLTERGLATFLLGAEILDSFISGRINVRSSVLSMPEVHRSFEEHGALIVPNDPEFLDKVAARGLQGALNLEARSGVDAVMGKQLKLLLR